MQDQTKLKQNPLSESQKPKISPETAFQLIMERQNYLENEILGFDSESKWYVIWTWGSWNNFWQVNLWDYLEKKYGINFEMVKNTGDFLKQKNEPPKQI